MRYERVCIDGFGYTLPREVVSTAIIEERLAPLYRRLRLPEGRLELMSGIRERRFWPENTSITKLSIRSAERAIEAARVERDAIGALVHGSVCRDYLEPATACGVHAGLSLPTDCAIYDVSNACLGILNGVVQIANMIELGQIQAGLAVREAGCHTEAWRDLVDRHMMHAVDAELAIAIDAVHQRAQFDFQAVPMRLVHRVEMRQRVGAVFGDMEKQVPALRNVEELHAGADSEYRHAALRNLADDHPIERLAAAVEKTNGRVQHPSIAARVEIGPADEEQPIKHIEKRIEIVGTFERR